MKEVDNNILIGSGRGGERERKGGKERERSYL